VNEKIDALAEARTIMIRRGDSTEVLANYRKIVAAKGPCVCAKLSVFD
jgi:hypothetical protein